MCSHGYGSSALESAVFGCPLSQDVHRKLHPDPSMFVLAEAETREGLVETAPVYLLIISCRRDDTQFSFQQKKASDVKMCTVGV